MTNSTRPIVDWLPLLELGLAAAAGALWYTQGGWASYAGTWPGPWPLLLLGLLWVVRGVWCWRHRPRDRRALSLRVVAPAPVVVPLSLFLVTAALSLRAAYDPPLALAKGWLLVGALGLYWATAHQPDRLRITAALVFWLHVAAGLSAFFLITHDWPATPYAGSVLQRVAATVAGWLPAALAREQINPNVAGGMLAVLLPSSVPVVAWAWRSGRRIRPLLVGYVAALVAVALAGLWLTGSRGAQGALAVVAGGWVVGRLLVKLPALQRALVVGPILVAAGAGAAVLGPRLLPAAMAGRSAADAPTALANRFWLWQVGSQLVRDAPFTGFGLGMFEMPFAVYALLIHVGFVEHSHNMLLDMAIDQGILGAAAFAALVVTATVWGLRLHRQWLDATGGAEGRRALPDRGRLARTRPQDATLPVREAPAASAPALDVRLALEAALAALAALVLHGLLDDVLYGTRGVLLLWVPFGLLVAVGRLMRDGVPGRDPAQAQEGEATPSEASSPRTLPADPHPPVRRRRLALILPLLTLVLVGGIIGVLTMRSGWTAGRWPASWVAAWYANQGAVSQARVELSAYDSKQFNRRSIEDVRREVDLSAAEADFARALAYDPANATACQRLTEIALANGDYDRALALMTRAWEAGHRDRVTRLLYSDSLVAAGRVDEAVAVAQGLPFAEARMLGQAWDRYRSRGDDARADDAYAAAARLEP